MSKKLILRNISPKLSHSFYFANIVKAEYNRESLLSKIVKAHPIFVFRTNIVKAEYNRESLLSKIVKAHPIFVFCTNV